MKSHTTDQDGAGQAAVAAVEPSGETRGVRMQILARAKRPLGALSALTTLMALAVLVIGFGTANAVPQTPASFTFTNAAVDGPGHCLNGSPVNCNIYDGKQYVWMNG